MPKKIRRGTYFSFPFFLLQFSRIIPYINLDIMRYTSFYAHVYTPCKTLLYHPTHDMNIQMHLCTYTLYCLAKRSIPFFFQLLETLNYIKKLHSMSGVYGIGDNLQSWKWQSILCTEKGIELGKHAIFRILEDLLNRSDMIFAYFKNKLLLFT